MSQTFKRNKEGKCFTMWGNFKTDCIEQEIKKPYTECKKFHIQTLRVCRWDKTKPFCYVTNIWQLLCFLARGPWRVWRRMVPQKLLKMSSVYINAQLVSACKWLCLSNNCCSFCHTGNQLFWSVYRCLVHQTLHLLPHKEIHRSEIGRKWWPL